MRYVLILLAGAMLTGCLPFRRAKATPPPPGPMPVRIPDQPTSTAPAPPPVNLPAPPPVEAKSVDPKAASTRVVGLKTAPTAKPPRPTRRRRSAKAKGTPTAESATVEEAPASPPVYRLGELRSPEERVKLKQEAEQMLGVCQAALAASEGRPLTAMQTEMVGRVRAFAQQARDTIERDPAEARGLAAKGKLFAEALLAELK
jgi:hypothetical protein